MATQATAQAAVRVRRGRFLTRTDLLGWAFVTPWLVGFLVFTAFPFAASLFLSLTNWDVTSRWTFIGLQNYQTMVSGKDDLFLLSLKNTTTYALVQVPGSQIIALALAMLLNKRTPGIAVYRTIFYIPAIASGVGTAYMWQQIFGTHGGLVNSLLNYFGVDGPNWLYDLNWSMRALVIIGMWNVGTSMLIYLAALQGVPQSLFDAASVDGATVWRKFLSVTVPMITPAMFFNFILGVIGSFQVFTAAYIITQGGPANATLFYTLYLYRVAFGSYHMGFAAAMAWVLFVIILIITMIQLVVARYWVYYEGGGAGTAAGPR